MSVPFPSSVSMAHSPRACSRAGQAQQTEAGPPARPAPSAPAQSLAVIANRQRTRVADLTASLRSSPRSA